MGDNVVKPLKLDSGLIKQFNSVTDELPNQQDIDYNLLLIRKILYTLWSQGVVISDPTLLYELGQYSG